MTPVAGDLLKPFRIANVSPETMKSWAKVLRDPNPIHLDPKAVMAMGLGDRVINQGPVNLAYVISMLYGAFPGSRLELLDVKYVANVFGGDAVESSGKVTAVEQVDGVTKVTCEIWLRAETRGPVISGTATVVLPFA
jgi:3-hydroxybutyryl-CoA dehydratase